MSDIYQNAVKNLLNVYGAETDRIARSKEQKRAMTHENMQSLFDFGKGIQEQKWMGEEAGKERGFKAEEAGKDRALTKEQKTLDRVADFRLQNLIGEQAADRQKTDIEAKKDMQESEETFQMAFLREKNNLSKKTQEYLMGVEADINKELAALQNDLNILRDKKASENRIKEVQAQYDSMLQYGQEMEAFARETEKGMYEEDGKYYSPTLGKTYTWNDRPSHEAALRDMQADWQAYLNRQAAGLRDSGKGDDPQNLFDKFLESMYSSGSLAGYVNEDGTINMEKALEALGGVEGAHDFLDEYMDGDDTNVYTPENRALMHKFLDRFIETGEAPIEQGEIPDTENLYPAEKEAMVDVLRLKGKLNDLAQEQTGADKKAIKQVSEQLDSLLAAFETEGDYFERNNITVNEAIENLFNQTRGGGSPSATQILDSMGIDWRTLQSSSEPVITTFEPPNSTPDDSDNRQASDEDYVDQAFENADMGKTIDKTVDLDKRNAAIIRKIDGMLKTASDVEKQQLLQWKEMLQDPETDQMERIQIFQSVTAMENE